MKRGDFFRVHKPGRDPKRYRIFVIISRQVLIDSRFWTVVCAPVLSAVMCLPFVEQAVEAAGGW